MQSLCIYLLVLLCLSESCCSSLNNSRPVILNGKDEPLFPVISPNAAPQPFLPFLAPSPLGAFTNYSVPKLSVCPLDFPIVTPVSKGCQDGISNQTACCNAIAGYVSHLQKQSFTTNLQALDCATRLGLKFQKENITKNVFELCQVSLKDFSLQVGPKESGCLLPSMPSDVVLDEYSGISFLCDLNDNILAPWPSTSQLPTQSCNRTVKIPALPAAASGQRSIYNKDVKYYLLIATLVVLLIIL